MRRSAPISAFLILAALSLPATQARAQEHVHQKIPQEQLTVYAKAFAAIAKVRDGLQAEMAEAKNKKPEAQEQLHAKLLADVAKVLKENGLTEAQYSQLTYVVSTDSETRKAFDLLMGIAPPVPTATATMSANPHINHLMSSFNGTPNSMGLMATAMAEAKVVAQHAMLATRNTTSLDAMKLHAGHVLHALEPAEGATGPGGGYGLKKAAVAVVTHVELAAQVQGAPAGVTTHAVHIATAARNTVQRADQLIAIAKQIQAATAPEEAAKLIAQMKTLADQVIAGADANGDGKIGWEQNEGGLQHVEQHLGLMTQAG